MKWSKLKLLLLAMMSGALLGGVTTGCAPVATYPSIGERPFSFTQPNFEPLPTLMAEAIRFTHIRFGGGREFAINLPPDTYPVIYDTVIKKLGEGTPMTSADQWAYHIISVRSRGFTAEVDIIYPRESGPHELMTIHLRRKVLSYSVEHTRLWRIHVDVPPPHYVPPSDSAQDGAAEAPDTMDTTVD